MLGEPEVQAAVRSFVQRAVERSERLTLESRIDIRAVGPVEVGMTVAEVERVVGSELQITGFDTFEGACYHASSADLPGIEFMVQPQGGAPPADPRSGEVVRVEFGTPWRTVSGIGVGSLVDDVRRTYDDRLRSEPHEYSDRGLYLTFEPRDAVDRGFGVRFVSGDGLTIDRIYSGRSDAIQLVEGCA